MNQTSAWTPASENDIIAQVLAREWSPDGVEHLIEALKFKRCIVSAVIPSTVGSETFAHFLERFWNYDTSPYVREKRIVGQSIHRRYTGIMQSRARTYWIPRLGNLPLAQVTKCDIKRVMWQLATQRQVVYSRKLNPDGTRAPHQMELSSETVNQIVRAATCALKWAYQNGLTQNDCFSGLVYCHVNPQKRGVLTLSQARALFKAHWADSSSRLANLTAMCTGMRIGEVQALRMGDIGRDRIYVRHNWARQDGLKPPKNGEEREILIPPELRRMLTRQGMKNPWGTEPDDFIFYGRNRKTPRGCRHWNEALHEVMKSLGMEDVHKITFHSWRHFFASCMADHVDERKLQLATGHKSLRMLEHYAAHESEQTLCELGEVAQKLFLGIVRLPVA